MKAERVERIKQGLANKKEKDPEWKSAGKAKNNAKWEAVKGYLSKGGLTAEEVAKLADVGVATVYRIKKEMKAG